MAVSPSSPRRPSSSVAQASWEVASVVVVVVVVVAVAAAFQRWASWPRPSSASPHPRSARTASLARVLRRRRAPRMPPFRRSSSGAVWPILFLQEVFSRHLPTQMCVRVACACSRLLHHAEMMMRRRSAERTKTFFSQIAAAPWTSPRSRHHLETREERYSRHDLLEPTGAQERHSCPEKGEQHVVAHKGKGGRTFGVVRQSWGGETAFEGCVRGRCKYGSRKFEVSRPGSSRLVGAWSEERGIPIYLGEPDRT